MRILVVAPRLPFPLDKGDRLTVFHMLKFLSSRHRVALACFAEPEQDPAWVREVAGFCERVEVVRFRRTRAYVNCATGVLGREPLQLRYYTDPAMHRAVARLVRELRPELAYAHLIRSGAYIQQYSQIPRVIAPQVSMTLNYRRLAEFAPDPFRKAFYALELRKLKRFEDRFVRLFDRALFISKYDVRAMDSVAPLDNVFILPHGVDFEYFSPQAGVEKEPSSVVMTGNMGYAPNADAAVYFCKEILPLVREQRPDVKVRIVGGDPPSAVRALGKIPSVQVTGWVPDLRVSMQRAEVAVAPIRIAAGLQNKVLEGMSMGLPVVITPAANEAIQAIDGQHVLIGRDAEQFANHVARLLKGPSERAELGARARRLIVREWPWEKHLAMLERLFEDLVMARRTQKDRAAELMK